MNLIFISYKRQDIEFAREVKGAIEAAGFLGWIDENIRGGEEWRLAIDTAIKDSLGVIVIVTPAALGSQYVTYEWSYALGLGKLVIPLILQHPKTNSDEPQMHPRLDVKHYRDFSDPDNRPWAVLFSDLAELREELSIPPVVERASRTLQESHNPTEWLSAIQSLEKHSHPKATEALAEAVGNDFDEISVQVAISLARKTSFKDLRALPGLRRAMKRGNHNYHRDAIDALQQFGNDEAVQILLDAYSSQGSLDVTRKGIFKALHRLSHPLASEFFWDVFRTSGSREDAANAALSLARLKDQGIFPELEKMMRDPAEFIRARIIAIEAMGTLGDPAGIPALIEELDKYPNHIPQDYVEPMVKALVQIGNDIGLTYLEGRRYKNSIPWLRQVIDAALPAKQ